MMTKQELAVYLTSILATVAATPGGVPSGTMYAVVLGKMSLSEYSSLLAVAQTAGYVTVTKSHLVEITEKGRGVVAAVEALTEKSERSDPEVRS
jgi:predicted methyltransferase